MRDELVAVTSTADPQLPKPDGAPAAHGEDGQRAGAAAPGRPLEGRSRPASPESGYTDGRTSRRLSAVPFILGIAARALAGATFRVVPSLGSGGCVWHSRGVLRQSRNRSLRLLGSLFALPLLASALIAWWLIGDLSEEGGYLQILPLSQSPEVALIAGVTGILVALLFCRELWAMRRRRGGRIPRDASRLAATSAAVGVFTAFVLRALSMKADGANIGGGILMMYGPVLVLPLLVYAYRRWRALARS